MTNQTKEIQRAKILRYMKERGSISSTKAVVDLGIARLASRIHEMKEAGMPIVGRWEYEYDNDGKIVKKWKEYSVLNDVEDFPAADVRPVVRGKWKVSVHKTYYDVSCSVCGINSFFQVDEKGSVSYANFCPNCGADMREES